MTAVRIPVAVMKGKENLSLGDAAEFGPRPHRAASRGNLHAIPVGDSQALGVGLMELNIGLGSGLLKLCGTPGLGARVPMVNVAPGGEPKGIVLIRLLGRRQILRRLEESSAGGIVGPILVGTAR